LRESEERFRELADNTRAVFWMVNPEMTKTLYVSRAYEEVWGRSCASLYQNPGSFLDGVHPDDRPEFMQILTWARVRGRFSHEYRVVRPDGSIRWIWDRGFPIHDGHGNVYRMAGIAEDITE